MKPFATLAFSALLTVCLGTVSAGDANAAPKKSVFTSYSQPGPLLVITQDENAGKNVRNQYDYTVPVHGPLLTNPEYDSITVMWITRTNCGAGIEYREKGQQDFKRVWDRIYGQIDCGKSLHTLHLTGLKPATEYEYRFVSTADRSQGYYHGVFTGREIYSFKTLDPNRKSYQVFFTADIHGSLRLCLDPMLDRTPAMESDFFIYLGDNVEDTMGPDPRFHITFGFVDDIVRRYGTNKASVFVRGNHDSAGQRTYDYYRYFPHRTGKGYYSFSQGGVIYVVLETIWHYDDNQIMKAYLQEQLEWFRELKKTDAWKKAEFRILNAHVGTFGNAPHMSPEWSDELNTTDPENRIHLFMTGHHHDYIRIDPNATESKVGKLSPKALPDAPGSHPYTMIVGESCDSFIMKVESGKLTLTSYDWHNDPVTLRDQFSIAPDGKVTDLMNVKKIPFPEKNAPKGKKNK